MSSLGSGEVQYDETKPVIHFGSPLGSQYGSTETAVIRDFQAKHPDFEITNK